MTSLPTPTIPSDKQPAVVAQPQVSADKQTRQVVGQPLDLSQLRQVGGGALPVSCW